MVSPQLLALVRKNPPANARDTGNKGSIPGLGRYPGEGNDNPLQFSCLENSTDRGAWWATVHAAAKELDMTEHIHTQPQLSIWLPDCGLRYCIRDANLPQSLSHKENVTHSQP